MALVSDYRVSFECPKCKMFLTFWFHDIPDMKCRHCQEPLRLGYFVDLVDLLRELVRNGK